MTIRTRFKSSISRGTGEAILLQIKYPKMDFSKEIIFACTNRLVYEAQAGDTRAQYYADLIDHRNLLKKHWYVNIEKEMLTGMS